MHLNDSSLFCVFTSLEEICSPNSLFMTDIIVPSFLLRCTSLMYLKTDTKFTYLRSYCVFAFSYITYMTMIEEVKKIEYEYN